ncbi:MAG: hypothetical protein ACYDBQ_02890 [Thermoplasmatota archaeon]
MERAPFSNGGGFLAPSWGLPGSLGHPIAAMGAGLFARVPFLPVGKGALILILGGLLMLAFSFVMGTGSRTVPPSRATPGRPAPRAALLVPPPSRPPAATNWVGSALERALRVEVGPTTASAPGSGSLVVVVEDCLSCTSRIRRRGGGCPGEASAIERAVRLTYRKATALEIACRASGAPRCSFELHGFRW